MALVRGIYTQEDLDAAKARGYRAGVRAAENLCWMEVSRRNDQVSTTGSLPDAQRDRWVAMAIEAETLAHQVRNLNTLPTDSGKGGA